MIRAATSVGKGYIGPNILRYVGRICLWDGDDDYPVHFFATDYHPTREEAEVATDALVAELIEALKGLQSCGK